jgi:hypothetical protein
LASCAGKARNPRVAARIEREKPVLIGHLRRILFRLYVQATTIAW